MPFEFTEGPLKGAIIIQPRKFTDSRGFFLETYKKSEFLDAGIDADFVQDNHSLSFQGVLRGLHFQNEPHAQGKLVRIVTGAVWDVAVDLRPGSPDFGKWFGLELNDGNGTMLFIPPGFAHGYLSLADNTHVLYKCTADFAPGAVAGVRWDDPDLGIHWPLEGFPPLVSEKDMALPLFKDIF